MYRAQMLGEGGFHKDVALKVMNPGAGDADTAERQRDEARLLGLIRHRSILQVDGLVRLHGTWAVVMEYIDGANLAQVRKETPLPLSIALATVAEVAGALRVAHDATAADGKPLRIVHRDIKPSNIQLTTAGEVKLLDFGAARAEFAAREAHTVGVVLGTVKYMAPERLEGTDTTAGDIYALGVVLGEMVAGERVHKAKLVDAIRSEHGDTLEPFLDLVSACLATDPTDRPTAAELERRCWELCKVHAEPRLQDWCPTWVRAAQQQVRSSLAGDLSGKTLVEETATLPASSTSTQAMSAVTGLAVGSLLLLIGSLVMVCSGAGGLWYAWPSPETRLIHSSRSPVLQIVETGVDVTPARREDRSTTDVPIRPVPTAPEPVRPAPQPPPTVRITGTVQVTNHGGQAKLIGSVGTFRVPGDVPPGVYDLHYEGIEAVKGIVVEANTTTHIECQPQFRMCRRR